MEYTAAQLKRIHTTLEIVEDVMRANYIPIYRITLPGENLEHLDSGLRSSILKLGGFTAFLNQLFISLSSNCLYFMTDVFQCSYVLFSIPKNTDTWIVCGPVLFEEINEERFLNIFQKLHFPEELETPLRDYYHHTVFLPSQHFFETLLQKAADFLYGKDKYKTIYIDDNERELWYYRCTHYPYAAEEPFRNIKIIEERYEIENRLIHSVSKGNETAALELLTKSYYLILPHCIPYRLRNMKNYSITMNTLLRKAAEQSGVHPLHIDSLSNSNLSIIEYATSQSQCYLFWKRMIHDYCQLIKEYSLKKYSTIIGNALTYIHTDLRADLTLNTLAKYLSINASYLSKRFKQETGQTLTDYVNHTRIEYAQKLLLNTDLPIKSVAQFCGIPNINYFTRLFKQFTNMTPKEYRKGSKATSIKQ